MADRNHDGGNSWTEPEPPPGSPPQFSVSASLMPPRPARAVSRAWNCASRPFATATVAGAADTADWRSSVSRRRLFAAKPACDRLRIAAATSAVSRRRSRNRCELEGLPPRQFVSGSFNGATLEPCHTAASKCHCNVPSSRAVSAVLQRWPARDRPPPIDCRAGS